MLRAIVASFSLVLLLGVYYSAGIQLPVYDVQRAVVAEFLKAVFSHLTPLSSLLGQGVEIAGGGFVLRSSHGLLPLVSLIAAGLLIGLMCRSLPQAVLAALTTSMLLIISSIALLIGFLPNLQLHGENIRWQVDAVFMALFMERPLELPVIIAVPMLSSIPTGMVMERFWSHQSRMERPLFSWRRRGHLRNVA